MGREGRRNRRDGENGIVMRGMKVEKGEATKVAGHTLREQRVDKARE